MIMVDPVASAAFQSLSNILIENAHLLRGVGDKVEQIRTELKRMQSYLRRFAGRRQSKDFMIENWKADVRKLALDVEDIVEMYTAKVVHGNLLKRTIYRRKVSLEIQAINSRLNSLHRSIVTYLGLTINEAENSIPEHESIVNLRRSNPLVNEDTGIVVGLKEDIAEIVGRIMNKNGKKCYICGMGGVGKTTLATEIFHHPSIRRHFCGFAWVNVTQQCRKREVWEAIMLGLTASEKQKDRIKKKNDSELQSMLYRIQQEKNCLIILDDIWSTEAWEMISPAFPSQNTRSAIIFTSRNKNIALHADPKELCNKPERK